VFFCWPSDVQDVSGRSGSPREDLRSLITFFVIFPPAVYRAGVSLVAETGFPLLSPHFGRHCYPPVPLSDVLLRHPCPGRGCSSVLSGTTSPGRFLVSPHGGFSTVGGLWLACCLSPFLVFSAPLGRFVSVCSGFFRAS